MPTTLKTNVQVCARIRPPQNVKSSPKETQSQDNANFVAWSVDDDRRVYESNKTEKVHGRTSSYTLDKIFGTSSTTNEIYNSSVASLVKAAMEGYNSTVMAYGQTSTGKTHTMTGKKEEPGLVPLCIKDCFKYCRESSNEPREYLFRFSYLEIYKEHIRDLLSTSVPEPVRLFDGPDGLVVRGLKEVVVSSPSKVFQLLQEGDKRRHVGATYMNQQSSRSHVVVRLKIESSHAKTDGKTRVSILSLVDLAGSESVRLNGAERREEGQYINKSLMALGQVVNALSESCKTNGKQKRKSHIPYRDSKLTRLLQSSLSGNAQMLLLCCISPSVLHLEESHNTFKFATRAKRIEQKASIHTAKNKEETMLQTYRNEIEELKKQLAEATQQKQQLLEEQRALRAKKQQEAALLEKSEAVVEASTIPNVDSSRHNSTPMESTNGEIDELIEAIQAMEKLIIKSHPLLRQQSLSRLVDDSEGTVRKNGTSSGNFDHVEKKRSEQFPINDEEDHKADYKVQNRLMMPSKPLGCASKTTHFHDIISTDPSVERNPITGDRFHSELNRVRDLLSTVLQERDAISLTGNDPPGDGFENVRKSLVFSSPYSDPPPSHHTVDESPSKSVKTGTNRTVNCTNDEIDNKAEERNAEIESLQVQLQRQERVTSLRKADSRFLQAQLREKDRLLEDVSSLLEVLEKRQEDLEHENHVLKCELNAIREERGEERGIIIFNTPF